MNATARQRPVLIGAVRAARAWRWPAWRIAPVLLLLASALPARAHNIYTSWAEAMWLPDRLELTVTIARANAPDLIVDGGKLPPLTPETFPEFEPRLKTAAPDLFKISAGGKPLAMKSAAVKIDGDADITFKLSYPRPAVGPLRFFAQYVAHLIDGHVATLVFTNPAGDDLGWAPVSIDQPVFETPLPKPAPAKKK